MIQYNVYMTLNKYIITYHSSLITHDLKRALAKHIGKQQREWHQIKCLMSRTMGVHVRYKSLFIFFSLPFAKQQQQRQMT